MDSKTITPREKRQNDTNALITECEVFFAFSQEQLHKGRANLPEGEKLIGIGAGGFMPTKNVDKFIAGMKRIERDFTQAMKDEKARTAHILYELNNHEAFYFRDISSTLEALGEDFTVAEVQHVFDGRRKEEKKLEELLNSDSDGI